MPVTKDEYSEDFYNKKVPQNEPYLKEKSELQYYSDKLAEALKKKDPDLYDKIPKWDSSNPSTSTTRIKKAEPIAKENPSFYLSPEEQKKVLGSEWDRYTKLRGKYGKDLNLTGEGDNPDKPETWKFGVRHVASFNPVSLEGMYKKQKDENYTDKFRYEMKYDPSNKENPYQVTENKRYKYDEKTRSYVPSELKNETSMNSEETHTRMLTKVGVAHDLSTHEIDDKGRLAFKDPKGTHFYKQYHDGSKENISAGDYERLKGFNKLPADQKEKFVETVPLSSLSGENRKIVDEYKKKLQQ